MYDLIIIYISTKGDSNFYLFYNLLTSLIKK